MTHSELESASPLHDPERLREIADLGLLDGRVDDVLSEIAREAATRLDLPISLVSVVLDEAQHFAASHGVSGWLEDAGGTPSEWSFCANSVHSREAFVVENAATHPLMRESPLVTADGIRCYAGIPLISSRGHVLGNLCVIGAEERTFGEGEMELLRGLAARAVARIEERRAPGS
ncbi:MAG TPA: GAF domain-containing protein [Longimicrobium sp.]|nr:GAF domain-containing protein [Longimicrobium sp.]